MATVFVVVKGQHGKNAQNFYTMFPAEAVLPNKEIISISTVKRVSRPSLYTLLGAILKKKDKEIVVVSHGVPTQLAIPVMPGINIGLNSDFINAILGKDSDVKLARKIRTSSGRIKLLRKRIKDVQLLSLSRLEFRACRVGQSKPMLTALERLFNARSVCAPKALDSYGRIRNLRPTTNAAVLRRWQSAHPRNQAFGTAPDRFFWVCDGSVDPPRISHAFAESWAGARAWGEAKFPFGARHNFRRGTLYYHFLTNLLLDSSSALGTRTFDNTFIFPNDLDYRNNLVQVQSTTTGHLLSPPGSSLHGRGPMGITTGHAALAISNNEQGMAPRRDQCRVPGPNGVLT